jgi:hypothetical protein
MRAPAPRRLVVIGAALTLAGGVILFQAGATSVGSGGVFGFLFWLYPLCLLPGALLGLASYLLYFTKSRETLAGYLGVGAGMASIPLALAGFLVGFVLAIAGSFLVLANPIPSHGTDSSAGGEGRSDSPGKGWGRAGRLGKPVAIVLVGLVAILLLCPQTIPANVVVMADLINDPVAFDLQLGYVLHDAGSSISYSVGAVSQSGNCALGYSYFLNGYSNVSGQAYWFQTGLSFDWGGGTLASSGWGMAYEVFGPDGSPVFPNSFGGAGVDLFSGSVNEGDSVVLSMSPVSAGVTLTAVDQSTHASASETYAISGVQGFGAGTAPQDVGYFTGLMTECYRNVPVGGSLNAATFGDQGSSQTEAGVFVDEINFSLGRIPYLPAVELPEARTGWTVFVGPSPVTFQAYGFTLSYSASAFTTSS